MRVIRRYWDPTDDYSRDSLILDEYTRTEKITAYQDGVLVLGEKSRKAVHSCVVM